MPSRPTRRRVVGSLGLGALGLAGLPLGRRGIATAAATVRPAGATAATGTPTPDPYPGAAPAYGVVIDGRLTWGRGLDDPRPPASLTKLLTALVLLGHPRWSPDAVVTVSPRAAAVEGSQLGLRAGEALRAADALTALLVRSANDCCVALVEHFAGSVEAFLAPMNASAAALGMSHSHFGDPCGLDVPGHHSTVRDLLRLGQVALRSPLVAERVRLPRAGVTTLGPQPRRLSFVNGNALVGRTAGVIGMKSGYTSRAGRCVVAVAERRGHQVWLAMLGAEERWWTAAGLIEAAFSTLPD